MKKKLILLITSLALIIFFSFLFLLSTNNKKYDIVVMDEVADEYVADLDSSYNSKAVTQNQIYTYLNSTKAMELDEYSAKAFLDAGIGVKFVPYYNVKTVLIQNKNKTDKVVKSLNEFKDNNLTINIVNGGSFSTKMIYMSISYSLNKEYKLDNAINYLKVLYDNKTLDSSYHKELKTDYLLTTSYEARRYKNENIEIYDIEEGSLTTNIGLLIFDESIDLSKYENILSNHNLKMNEYSNSFKCDDYNIFGIFSLDRVNKFRRNILNTYKFSGVNGDERAIILVIFLILMIPWAIYIGLRINDSRIRTAVVSCLVIVLTWLVFRYLRSNLSDDILRRYTWYLNYLPLIFAPALFLNANMLISLERTKKVKYITIGVFVISAILLFLVLFNDLFEFAFIFKNGLADWQTYGYGWLFYVICAVGFIELIVGITLLIQKNYKQTSKKVLGALVFMFIFIFTYIALDFIGVSIITEMDYTLIICLFAFSLWELALRAGLVQNCGKYYSLFNHITFGLALVSKNNETQMATKEYENDQNKNARFTNYEISNGYAIFRDDLEILDAIRKELENKKILLEKNNNTLKHEQEIAREYYSISNQNMILEEIDKDYKLKNDEIIELINKIEPLKEKKDIYPYLARIKFLVSYTKQKYNCYINAKMNEKIEIQTIALAINLIITDCKSLNVDASVLCNSMELIDSNLGVIILDLFYMMIENALDNKSDLFVNIDVNDDAITMFGLFKDNSNIKTNYFTNNVSSLISNNKIIYEIKKNDDMLKLSFKIKGEM